MCCRSAADSRASLLIMPISVPSAERFTTAATTARRSRSALISVSSASRWTAATAAAVTWPSSTLRALARLTPSSRRVVTSSSRATQAASYSLRSPSVREAGGTSPLSDQNRMVRTGTPTRLASSPIVRRGLSFSMAPVWLFQ